LKISVRSTDGTALHSGKDFAVSAGLNRVISVRTSILADDRRYLLPLSSLCICGREDRMFGLSSVSNRKLPTATIRHRGYYMLKLGY